MSDESPPLLVDVPICAFRPFASREYQDTFPVPTPSSVYGMLLSLVGEPSSPNASVNERHLAKAMHRGAQFAIAVEEVPMQSKVFRKLRRGADLENIRPDYQDLLMELRMWLWIRRGNDPATTSLARRTLNAIEQPRTVRRFGGLSLGESSYLIDTISQTATTPPALRFIIPDTSGFYSLPVWVDHTDSKKSVRWRFRISDPISPTEALSVAWLEIGGQQDAMVQTS